MEVTTYNLMNTSYFKSISLSIPGMGEPGWLPSMGSHRVRHDWSDLAAAAVSPYRSHSFRNNSQLHRVPEVAKHCALYSSSIPIITLLPHFVKEELPRCHKTSMWQDHSPKPTSQAKNTFSATIPCRTSVFRYFCGPNWVDSSSLRNEQCMFKCISCSVVSDSLWPHWL